MVTPAIIPLGDHCLPALILKELAIRGCSYPFDWITFQEQLYTTNISYNIKLIKRILNGNSIDVTVSDLIGNANTAPEHVNTETTMWFAHEDFKGDYTEKYSRRFTRLIEHATSQPCLFIYITRYATVPVDDICEFIDEIRLRNSKHIHILIIGGRDITINIPDEYKIYITYQYIKYDPSRFYAYDYSHFRPQVKSYMAKTLPTLIAALESAEIK